MHLATVLFTIAENWCPRAFHKWLPGGENCSYRHGLSEWIAAWEVTSLQMIQIGYLVGGCLPLWKIWKSNGIIIPSIWEHKKRSKPPTRIYILDITGAGDVPVANNMRIMQGDKQCNREKLYTVFIPLGCAAIDAPSFSIELVISAYQMLSPSGNLTVCYGKSPRFFSVYRAIAVLDDQRLSWYLQGKIPTNLALGKQIGKTMWKFTFSLEARCVNLPWCTWCTHVLYIEYSISYT